MGFRLHCDRCGAFVKNVNPNNVRELGDKNICKTCAAMDARLKEFVIGLKAKYTKRFDDMIRAAKQEMEDRIAALNQGGQNE